MAGKNIYIEKILDNLLGGIDAALASMKEAIYKMIGGEDPEIQKSLPDVVDQLVANQAATAQLIENTGEKLDAQILELQGVINAVSQTVNPANLIITDQGELSKNMILENLAATFEKTESVKMSAVWDLIPSLNVVYKYNMLAKGVFEATFKSIDFDFYVTNPSSYTNYNCGLSYTVTIKKNNTNVYSNTKSISYQLGSSQKATRYESGQDPTAAHIPVAVGDVIQIDIVFSKSTNIDAAGKNGVYFNNTSVDIPENIGKISYDFKDVLLPGGVFEVVS